LNRVFIYLNDCRRFDDIIEMVGKIEGPTHWSEDASQLTSFNYKDEIFFLFPVARYIREQ